MRKRAFERMAILIPEQQRENLRSLLQEKEGIAARGIRFVVSPYRICPIGAHIDHQGGPVLGMTIAVHTRLAFAPLPEPVVRLHSLNYGDAVAFDLHAPGTAPMSHWSRYLRGAAEVLRQAYPLQRGLVGAVFGPLPGGGLSSSASVGLAYLHALAAANALVLAPEIAVELDRRLENDYLGLQNGVLDQASITYGRKGHLVFIETRNFAATPIPLPDSAPAVRWLIAYSGFSRELTASGFNTRVEECREAARQLGRRAGIADAEMLSDIPPKVYQRYRQHLPADLQRRSAHFFSEVARVQQGKQAWQAGDLTTFGQLMNESCRSSIAQYESGSPALKALWEMVSAQTGVLGSRFSGGGYGGCVIGLVRAEAAEDVVPAVFEAYRRAYPQTPEPPQVFLTDSDDGVRIE